MTASDPYASRCLHGTLPLVRDESSPGGVRFALIGKDEPEACVATVAEMPDAEMTLRLFSDYAERSGYLAALREHGGNAFSALESPDTSNGVTFALILRHDRARAPAETLDEAVRLVGDRAKAAGWANVRGWQIEARDKRRAGDANNARWAHALKAIKATPDAILIEVGETGANFMMGGGLRLARLSLREAKGLPVLEFDMPIYVFPEKLATQFAADAAASGAIVLDRGHYRIPMRAHDAESLAEALDVAKAVRDSQDRLAERKQALGNMEGISANAATSRVLARLCAGYLLMHTGDGDPAAQASPRNGAHQTVPGTMLARLLDLGLVRLGWKPEGHVNRDVPETWCPRLYLPTAAGIALAQGRVEEAAGLCVPSRSSNRWKAPALHAGGLFEALEAMREDLPGADLQAMGDVVEPRFPREGLSLADAVNRQRGYDGWCAVVQGALAGRLEVDGALRMVHVAPESGPTP